MEIGKEIKGGKKDFKLGLEVGSGLGIGLWMVFRVRVRDRVSVRAKGWMGFMYYGPMLLELKPRSGGGFGKKTKSCRKSFKISPANNVLHEMTRMYSIILPWKKVYRISPHSRHVFHGF